MVRILSQISLEKKVGIVSSLISASITPVSINFKIIIGLSYYFLYLSICTFCIYCRGWYPSYRARELSYEERLSILRCGLVHHTIKESAIKILKDGYIKNSNMRKSYSMHFKKSVFFYRIDEELKKELVSKFLDNNKHLRTKVKILNLTDDQVKNLKIRKSDNAIMFPGNFHFKDENIVIVEEF